MIRLQLPGMPIFVVVILALIIRIIVATTVSVNYPYQAGVLQKYLATAGFFEKYPNIRGYYDPEALKHCHGLYSETTWDLFYKCILRYTKNNRNPANRMLVDLPGYPMIIALLHTITGSCDKKVILLFNALLDTALLIIFFMIVKSTLGEDIAILAALLYAICPLQVFVGSGPHRDPYPAWALLGVIFIEKKLEGNDLSAFLQGLIIGIGTWIRSLTIFFTPGIIVYMLFRKKYKHKYKHIVIFLLALIGPLLPWIYVNYVDYGKIFLTTLTGHALYIGLGRYPNPWGIKWKDECAFSKVHEIDLSVQPYTPKYNEIITREAIGAILQHPIDFLEQSVAKLVNNLLLDAPWRITNGSRIFLLVLFFSVVGLIGIIKVMLKDVDDTLVLMLFGIITYILPLSITFAQARHLLPVAIAYYVGASIVIKDCFMSSLTARYSRKEG